MSQQFEDRDEEEAYLRRREARREKMRQRKRKQRMIRFLVRVCVPVVLCLCVFIGVLINVLTKEDKETADRNTVEAAQTASSSQPMAQQSRERTGETPSDDVAAEGGQEADATDITGETSEDAASKASALVPQETSETVTLGDEIVSTHVAIVDLNSNQLLAGKAANERMNPASMTKIMTILVAAEAVDNLDDTVTITRDITDYCYMNDCSNVGFEPDETVTVRDLFYGTILPSGADAALGLVNYVAGSQEAFVELMNQKAEELGISDSAHFTNCSGIYDENHYCTAVDMAIILRAAYENEFCREVLSAHSYTTSATTQHPEGVTISNWFLRRIEDKDCGGTVLCAKTGYVVESGSCAASLALNAAGDPIICVTAGSSSSWRCIYDHVDLYTQFLNAK